MSVTAWSNMYSSYTPSYASTAVTVSSMHWYEPPMCKNCRRPQEDHLENGKCLFGPGKALMPSPKPVNHADPSNYWLTNWKHPKPANVAYGMASASVFVTCTF